jgi:hypothetical protein
VRFIVGDDEKHLTDQALHEPETHDRVARYIGGTVGVFDILSQVDQEINQLKQARALLASGSSFQKKRVVKKRKLTPEGRRRIIEAVKRRWAAQRKTTRNG